MSRRIITRITLWTLGCVLLPAVSASAEIEILGSHYIADKPFPRFYRYWSEECTTPDTPDLGADQYADRYTLGGYVHVFVRNSDSAPVTIDDIRLDGVSLGESIVFSEQRIKRKFASIHFAKLAPVLRDKLIAAGEPVWWKADPPSIPAGQVAQAVVRLRRQPVSSELKLTLIGSGDSSAVTVPTRERSPRLAAVAFSPKLDSVNLYVDRDDDRVQAPTRVLRDGRDITRSATISHDPALSLSPISLRLDKQAVAGRMHCFQVVYADGATATAALRAWSDEFAYGMWGARTLPETQAAEARAYVKDLTDHNINVQMPQVGSRGVVGFFKSTEGQRYCESVGLRIAISDPGKYGTPDPYAYFIHDEPDAGDYLAEGLNYDQKIGALAQWAISRSHQIREQDGRRLQFLNVDSTFKPDNWYTYAQLPDIFMSDPYYGSRLRTTYSRHPYRLPIYSKPTFIYGEAMISHWACAPNPMHLVLYAVNPSSKDEAFRFPTPEEKRIEAYYALAAGARGLSYWWFTPSPRPIKSAKIVSDGIGAHTVDPQAAALWREIGLLGAEIRTAGPLLMRSCPLELPAAVSTPGLWPRFLAVGDDTLVILVMNEQYANDRVGTVYQAIDESVVSFDAPSWLKAGDVFEIIADGIQDVSSSKDGERVALQLGRVELTRLIVLTQDKELRGRLQERHDKHFASTVKQLRSAGAR